ncbi:MAG TPA: enolase C-terminal domain-like protein, partial [Woeseiaceae bacterium]|nr:enolase C-terminal domain-like protein [Woeseiaceae bacterium]
MDVEVRTEQWELKQPFRITGHEWHHSECIVVELGSDGARGRGEAQGVSYLGENAASMRAQIESIMASLRRGVSRQELAALLPAGGARNAVDCALWDLEAKAGGQSIWQLTGIEPGPVTTVFTIGLEATPQAMADKARAAAAYPVLKIKLSDDRPLERLSAIRDARPDARLVVDANQGWDFALLQRILPACADLRLDMIEQPLPRGADAELEGFRP